MTRAGLAYVGMTKQGAPNLGGTATDNPPRDIPFQINVNTGYVLEFGDSYMRIKFKGGYITETPLTISAITNANPAALTITAHGYSVGDWVFINGGTGITDLNGLTWIVQTAPDANTITLTDLFGTPYNSNMSGTYAGGATSARIYTIASPYAAVDLPYLKYAQSDVTLSLCCVNIQTLSEYPPYDLERVSNTNWVLAPINISSSITAPTNVTVTAHSSTTVTTFYSYVVTAVDSTTGDESIASSPGTVENNDIAINAGSNTISWTAVAGASSYNVYAATPSFSVAVPIGSSFGYIGTAFGPSFTDTNIQADFTTVPPVYNNPFAPGQILAVNITNGGTGYTQATVGFTITTATGSNFAGTPIVLSGAIVGFLIDNNGKNYVTGDTIAFTGGTGATGTLEVGPQTGVNPGAVAYYQQRRVYAATLNNPDTYYMSKPGSYLNFDSSVPTVDSDSITGTPWAQQVNGIQFLVPMTTGLITLTGGGAWLVNGGNNADITPADQTAQAQAYNGCSTTVPPLVINYDILYVQAKNSIVRDLAFNFLVNVFTGTDDTVFSNHLFLGHTIVQWAYSEEPYKVVWAVRDDGVMLSLTYLKEQQVDGWSRHDTNGLVMGVCVITEPPVDAVYAIVKRFIRGQWVYYSERMNNRIWQNVEDCFSVDSGLSYPMTFPNATLMVSAATGNVTLTASSAVFTSANIGDIVRVGGGKVTVTGFTSSTVLTGAVTQTITQTIPNNPNGLVAPEVSGNWSISVPTTVVTALNSLEGQEVAILADGSVVPNQTVTNGAITLPYPASSIVVGLPYTCQLQSMYLDPAAGPTTQGKRKTISAVTVRLEQSRGIQVGTNQPDQSTQPNYATVPWTNMKEVKERNALITAGSAIPLFTGDERILVPGDWNEKGQVAIQQVYPLGATVLAIVPEFSMGDPNG